MDRKTIFQASALAAVTAFVGVLLQLAAQLSVPQGVLLQPGAPLPVSDFMRASNDYPDAALGFFGGDSLFILGYLLVFIGLYAVTAERARPFALFGMAAGVLTGLLDATENAFFITYALGAKSGMPLTQPALPLIYLITNLKWMAAFATLYAFGVVFPRTHRLEWLIAGLMLLFPVVGVLGMANASLVTVRGVFFLIGMPLFAWYFWGKFHHQETRP